MDNPIKLLLAKIAGGQLTPEEQAVVRRHAALSHPAAMAAYLTAEEPESMRWVRAPHLELIARASAGRSWPGRGCRGSW